jgi:poly(hydroxyalkanoate) granule-associated protein
MAKVDIKVGETAEEVERSPIMDTTHKVFLVGVGAAAAAQEALMDSLNKFVERGEIVEGEAMQILRDRMAMRKRQVAKVVVRRKKDARDSEAELEAELEAGVQGLLERMKVPTKSDIDALSAKITELTKKIDELNAG